MSYFECSSVTVLAIYCLNPKLRLRFVRNWVLVCTLMKMRTAAHSWFDLTNSLFFVFPSDIWCKINNQLKKYYEYQLTKRCLERRLEGFKVLKIMKVVKYRIAKIFIIVVEARLHHHYSWDYHVRLYFNTLVRRPKDVSCCSLIHVFFAGTKKVCWTL